MRQIGVSKARHIRYTRVGGNCFKTMNIYLDGENVSTGGTVEFVKCINCKYEAIALQLFADTDMVYHGVIGHGSRQTKELVLTRLTREEYNAYGRLTGKELSSRLNNIFKRADLEYFKSRHFIKEDGEKIWARICPNCDSYFVLEKRLNFDDFIKQGGKVICYSIHERT